MPKPKWQYDEMKQVGVDFADEKQVEVYDRKMAGRDFKREAQEIATALALKPNHTLLDIGTGTGELAIELAKRCGYVYTIDVSEAMVNYAKRKAASRYVSNISFHHAGFLTYQHTDTPLDAVTSQFALHHLPDFWKIVALRRIHSMLKRGGKFFLKDVVFSFELDDYRDKVEGWIARGVSLPNSFSEDEWCAHIRDEYSTFNWILEGMLQRVGFTIEKANYDWGFYKGFYGTYLCVKTP